MKQVNLKFVKSILLIAIGFIVSFNVSAQELTLTGQVVDTTGEPAIGANVLVKGSTTGTITDFDGNFSLRIPDGNAIILISFIGYEPIELPANSPLFGKKIVLHDDTQLLDDVIVIGYGQVKKGDATGAVLAVKPDEFNKGNLINPEEALVGKIAGVNVVPGGGAPGDNGTIRIRMGASLSASNDPLIVIDGFPQRGSASLNSINPNDIESFTVLKDASATAIYGSRASNGVIIITTKKGAEGTTRPKINYNSSLSVSTVYDYLDVLSVSEYKEAMRMYSNAPSSYEVGGYETDWQKEVYRAAFGQDHNLSVTGSYKALPYRLSVGYTNQNGIIKTNNFQRTSIGGVVTPKFFDKHLSVELNIKGSFEKDSNPGGSVAGNAAFFDPTRPIYDDSYPMEDGLGYWSWRNSSGGFVTLAATNPMAEINLVDRNKDTNRAIGSATFNYKVHGLEDLSFNLNLGFDVSKETTHNITENYSPQSWKGITYDGRGEDYKKTSKNRSTLLDFYANYNKDFAEKHNLNVMAGYGWQRFWYENYATQFTLDGEEIVSPEFDEAELYLISFFGRANYSYDSRYALTATLRADASSRFAKNCRWGYFPSAAFAWRLNNEAFLRDVDVLSDLKLRLSYGQTGQQSIGDYYVHLPTYSGSYYESSYKFGDKVITTYRPNAYDPNIKWETTETFNIGIDFGFLNNRISGSIDAFRRNTKDLLNEITVPAGSNFSNVINTNIGNMKGKGVEISLNAIPVKTKDWEWSISGNFTWANSEITKLNVVENESNFASTKTGNASGRNYLQLHTVGQTPYTFFLMRQAYDDNGNYIDGWYYDNDGELTQSYEDTDKYLTGKSSLAPYYFGFSTKLSYKNWDLGINAHGSAGNYVYNYLRANNSLEGLYDSNGTSNNILKSTLENMQGATRIFSDHYLEKGNFLRIDNIRLGYTFTKLWNRSSNLTVSFAVQNVVTFTGYSGIDPEIFSGIDNNTYQRPRIYMLGLNLNF